MIPNAQQFASEEIKVTRSDYEKIMTLIHSNNSKTASLLAEELGRALIVPDEDGLKDFVTMNSKVKFKDLETNKDSVFTLVYPHEADLNENKISILTPIGSALIGLKVGQEITWPLPTGKTKKIKVLSIEPRA